MVTVICFSLCYTKNSKGRAMGVDSVEKTTNEKPWDEWLTRGTEWRLVYKACVVEMQQHPHWALAEHSAFYVFGGLLEQEKPNNSKQR